ncbi:MAG: type transport system permease protein [Acidobacteriota bacterium]|jgi:ABC-2 type transport system permease protein|nr:type transport system permease protein [Acidobacteriota bacterium]
MRRLTDITSVFRIQLISMRAEAGPFLLAALVFPAAMYLFANAVGGVAAANDESRLRFLAGSIVFSLSLTSISWLGYLLLENRFTGRLKLFATLPLAPSSYIFGILVFAFAQAALATVTLILMGRALGVHVLPNIMSIALVVMLTVLCLCGFGVIIAARARSFTEGSLLTDALGAGLVFLAPIYYTAETMPHGLRVVSEWLPTTFAARAIVTTLAGGYRIGTELLALGLMAVATLALGFRLTKWRED